MLKAVFMDFYGTVAYELGPIAYEVVQAIWKDSTASSEEEVLRFWWSTFREKLSGANGEHFRTQHDVALENFYDLVQHFHSSQKPEQLLARMEEHWCTTELYPDSRPFMDRISLPVYFVTNSDDRYVFSAMKHHDLHPAGVITSEQARYSKPSKEIFQYALKKTGLTPDDVVHIGDSLSGDVACPAQVGIRSIWLNREGKTVPDDVVSASGLDEVIKRLNTRAYRV